MCVLRNTEVIGRQNIKVKGYYDTDIFALEENSKRSKLKGGVFFPSIIRENQIHNFVDLRCLSHIANVLKELH